MHLYYSYYQGNLQDTCATSHVFQHQMLVKNNYQYKDIKIINSQLSNTIG